MPAQVLGLFKPVGTPATVNRLRMASAQMEASGANRCALTAASFLLASGLARKKAPASRPAPISVQPLDQRPTPVVQVLALLRPFGAEAATRLLAIASRHTWVSGMKPCARTAASLVPVAPRL